MTTLVNHAAQQAMLRELRASGDPAAQLQARQLETLYHDREMSLLSDDVYDAAKMQGQPPPGWIRGSEHLDKLHQHLPESAVSNRELEDFLKPDKSGFRAEIYLPDPAVLGPGYKPAVVFKGSAGEVRTADGRLRDTTTEDFFANNFPQSVGMKTDYYDRAMDLARELQRPGFDFELAGHSLGGGMASAAAAVTGVEATTFNAAGLHPATARRFALETGVPVYDVSHRVTAYLVQGELLNNGVQEHFARLDVARRAQLGGVLKETGDLLQELPEARTLLQQNLSQGGMSRQAQDTVQAFVDKLADGNVPQLLRELPLAAGDVQPPLAAMTERNGRIVPRDAQLSLPELTQLAGPLVATLRAATMGAHVGHRAGEVAAIGGRVAEHGLDASGDVTRAVTEKGAQFSQRVTQTVGAAVRTGLHHVGEATATVRQGVASMEAGIDRLQGQVQARSASLSADLLRTAGDHLPDRMERQLDAQAHRLEQAGQAAQRRNQAEASVALQEGREDAVTLRGATRVVGLEAVVVTARVSDLQHDTIAGAGQWVDRTLDATGEFARSTTRHAPLHGAAVGGTVTGAAAALVQFNLSTYPHLAQTAALAKHALPAGGEAFERHLMTETVVPSLSHRIEQQEQAARHHLHPARSLSPQPATEDFSTFLDRMLKADDATFRKMQQALADTPEGHAVRAQAVIDVDRQEQLAAQQQMEQQMEQQQRTHGRSQ